MTPEQLKVIQDRAENWRTHGARAMATEDRAALLAYVEELEKLGKEAVCTFCGGVFPKDATGLIRDHIATCEARKDAYDTTLRAAEAERDAALERVRALEEALRRAEIWLGNNHPDHIEQAREVIAAALRPTKESETAPDKCDRCSQPEHMGLCDE